MIYVAGPQVTAGYWGLASTTASRFVADPFVGGGARMYCSNDMAKVLNNGHLITWAAPIGKYSCAVIAWNWGDRGCAGEGQWCAGGCRGGR